MPSAALLPFPPVFFSSVVLCGNGLITAQWPECVCVCGVLPEKVLKVDISTLAYEHIKLHTRTVATGVNHGHLQTGADILRIGFLVRRRSQL